MIVMSLIGALVPAAGKRLGNTPVPKPGLGAFTGDGKVQSISYISLRRISCIYTSCGMVKPGLMPNIDTLDLLIQSLPRWAASKLKRFASNCPQALMYLSFLHASGRYKPRVF